MLAKNEISRTITLRLVSLAAFPKSGVTYLSSLLFYALFPGQDPSEIERRYIVDIHINSLEGACSYNERIFYKNHYSFDVNLPVCADAEKAIYLIRDPVDIMNSTFDFLGLLGNRPTSLMRDDFVERWASSKGDVLGGGSTWPHHVASWMGQTRVPVLLVRYQDIVDAPAQELSRILNFLDLASDIPAIRTAVENSTMTAMRAREEDDIRAKRIGVFYNETVAKAKAEGARFINKGYRRSYDELSDRHKSLVDEAFGEVREKYLT